MIGDQGVQGNEERDDLKFSKLQCLTNSAPEQTTSPADRPLGIPQKNEARSSLIDPTWVAHILLNTFPPIMVKLVFMAFIALSWAGRLAAASQTSRTEVWISAQIGLPSGSGTAAAPYDGSTQPKFDALMTSFQDRENLTIHLSAGKFRSDVTVTNRWAVKPGWTIQGAGMYPTTCQMMGNLKGQHWDHEFFKSPSNYSTDHVTIQDLTIDCNWAELAKTADLGAKGEKFGAIYAIDVSGSYILIENVRQINSYGSWANLNEPFGIRIAAPSTGDATNNTIRYCRAEMPRGNYGSPFALHGWPNTEGNGPHFITNSSVYANYAAGQNNGLATGFTSGGVNGTFIKDSQIYDNTFEDCQSIYYQDTGTAEGITVSNNLLTRGWTGVAFVAAADPAWTKTGITITGNQLNLQNRTLDYGSASYGVAISGAAASDVSINRNQISFSPTGQGFKQFLTVSAASMNDSSVSDNTADEASAGSALAAPVRAQVKGYDITIANNKTPPGKSMTGLADRYLQPMAKALNLSTRATVGSGENILITGFIVSSATSKQVLVRAIGTSLKGSVNNPLSDPTLALYDETGHLIASNDDWKTAQEAEIQLTGSAPLDDAESAIIATVPSGSYTAVMGAKGPDGGIGLVEVYDLSTGDKLSLVNLSTRGYAGIDENVMIGGFIVGEGQNATIVIRGIGPSLASAAIQNPLPDPVLELHDEDGALIATNDNWQETQGDALRATGLAPSSDLEAAILTSVSAGNYSVVLRGNLHSTGVALLEAYRIFYDR